MNRKMLIIPIIMLMTTTGSAEYVNEPVGLNVRKSPNTGAEIIRVLSFGEKVEGAIKGGWMRTEEGYIKAEYLTDKNPLDDLEYLGEWRITAYAYTGSRCANGNYPTPGYTVACNSLPFGTQIYIEGVGVRTVEDTDGGTMGDEWCDLYLGDYNACVQWGDQVRKVWLYD